ncbi:MAG TPA: alpha/beta hydrolase [Stellaceae bacterium]|nr:alpha/beta hydrolase [Stellaceae bacterium]
MRGFYTSLIQALASVLLALSLTAAPALAEDAPSRTAPAAAHAPPLPADSVTHHDITLDGRKLAYTATAGSLPLKDEHGQDTAEIFYVSFTRDGVEDAAHRPTTYVFNGGPGASAAYLDIGALGPRVLALDPDGRPPQSERIIDNAATWLPFTDLVFIDPVGTGYSAAAGGEDAAAKQFWGVRQDLDSLAEIIRLHLTRAGRLAAPVYLVGESYGGFRAARLADALGRDPGVAPAGVVLISPALEFRLMSGDRVDVLSWALRLPSYAAAALAAQGKLTADALAGAEHFALTDYLTALAAGPPDGPAAQQLYARLAALTGLDEAAIARWQGRIPLGGYVRDARRGAGEIISPYDATVGSTDPNPWNGEAHDDPVLDASVAPFTRGFVAYARDELGFKTDLPFKLLNGEVSRRWDWSSGRGGGSRGTLGASDALARALALQPRLKVMIAHGMTDLLTPYMMSRYVADHLPAAERGRVALKLYDGGHMMYLRASSRQRLHDDAQAFYAAAPAD